MLRDMIRMRSAPASTCRPRQRGSDSGLARVLPFTNCLSDWSVTRSPVFAVSRRSVEEKNSVSAEWRSQSLLWTAAYAAALCDSAGNRIQPLNRKAARDF